MSFAKASGVVRVVSTDLARAWWTGCGVDLTVRQRNITNIDVDRAVGILCGPLRAVDRLFTGEPRVQMPPKVPSGS